MSPPFAGDYILGIDLGSNSVGWAMIALIDGEPHHLIRAGVRVFDAGMEGDIASGREESRNVKRRQMRLQRRQTWRRARRLKRVFNLLQHCGLLQPGNAESPRERQDFLNVLDGQIRGSVWFRNKAESGVYREPEHAMPYILRAAALDEQLEPYFLGRALYQLAQRRGFLSNRRQVRNRKDDDEGSVKKGIASLRANMRESGARTLGEYFSKLEPSQERIRARWTAREMFESEFDAIWAAQSRYYPELLSERRRKELRHALFFQRRLWFDRKTVGTCDLEKDRRRAPAYLLASQRFRLLQAVNNLTVLPPGEPERPLTPGDRQKLINELETKDDLKYDRVRKLLDLTKEYRFNLERGGEKTIRGNRTNTAFLAVFGERWLAMTAEERNGAVEYVRSFENPAKLAGAAQRRFGIGPDAAEKLAEISLEPEYIGHSREAIGKLLPLLEKGMTYGEAKKAVYPEAFRAGGALDLLPPVERALTQIRNPAVMRSLTELRKVVNAIIRQYGKPGEIRIELARDLKKSKKQREAISEANRRNEKARAKAAEEIVKAQVGIMQPGPRDIRKKLLWDECGGICPYTGRCIPFKSLYGTEPQFDIEHIIPFSRSMDNSFQNLTLCCVAENRNAKGNKTPWQAYNGDSPRYEQIVDRVKQFIGDRRTAGAKLQRFLMDDEQLESFLEDFRNRQLNDTAYATSLAGRYLGLLYGGLADANGTRRIQATSGQSTHYFRSLWKLNSVLGDGDTENGGYVRKSRADHRHHAVDAAVIGLTDAGMIKRLADAAQRAPGEHRRRFASLEAPWHNFVDTVREQVNRIVVSHRVSKKVSGALHEETIYSPPVSDGTIRVRKPLSSLTRNEIQDIADAKVKALVLAKLDGGDPQKVFAVAENFPRFPSGGLAIKKVRLVKRERPISLGRGGEPRHVLSGDNHHLEIYAEIDRDETRFAGTPSLFLHTRHHSASDRAGQ